jgi:ketosteroid isomerase-like protein
MATRREAFVAILAGAAGLASLGTPGRALADSEVPEAEARLAITTWLDALNTGDPAVVEKVLAPEFQIIRSDGSGYAKADYLHVLPKQISKAKIDKIVATGHGDGIVARYVADIQQTIAGQAVEAVAARLSVFRKEGNGWLIVAHVNTAKIG